MKKKGFTLIELLAVIVILGLLMAIAIPSVTKYITQSRKKTVTTTIGNYIGALTNQVNDMEYIFTANNTIYAVPIECIALERGGTDPFGKWYQANNAYWAYVLVQYDDSTSSYTYGFTFKDSAGYGLYPTTSEKLNENGSQVQTGLSLNRPTTGTITNITEKANWTGFDVQDNTSLIVLEASSEGENGNGQTTCTLCQKGDNYSEVEEEKNNTSDTDNIPPVEEETELPTYTTTFSKDYLGSFVNSNTPKSIIIISTGASGGTDISISQNGSILAWMDGTTAYISAKDSGYRIKPPSDCTYLFDGVENSGYTTVEYFDLGLLDMSSVSSTYQMFRNLGYNASTLRIIGLEKWNVSKVKNMYEMFKSVGYNATTVTIEGLNNWNTSAVTNMNGVFGHLGYKSSSFSIGDISEWDTSNVTNMGWMFRASGYNATTWNVGNISKWNTSKVTDMSRMFENAGKNSSYSLNLSNWNVSKVTSYSNFNNYVTDKIIPPTFG